MRGVAEVRGFDRPRAQSGTGDETVGATAFGAAGVVASARLTLAGSSRLTIPRLDRVPAEQRLRHGDRGAASVAASFVRAGIGRPEDWEGAEGNPFRFLKLALDRWVSAHGGDDIRKRFELSLVLSTAVDRYETNPTEANAGQLYLLVEPGSAGYVVVGPAIKLLERIRLRLGATFYHLLIGSLDRWVRVYDYRDAQERVEMLRDWYQSDPEAGAYEVPDVAGSVPAAMRGRPLQRRTVELLIERLRNRRAKRILSGVLELARVAEQAERPEVGENVREALGDSNPPLPALLAVFERRDAIEGCFDDEAQSMMEVYPEPMLIIPIDTQHVESVLNAFRVLGAACDTLACASRLISILPGNGD
jgi:hypothetical protein